MVTGKEMCEVIVKSELLKKQDGLPPSPEEIWNYSTIGELYKVFEWYEQAKNILKSKSLKDKGRDQVYIAKKISLWERIKRRLFKKYRLKCEQKQKQIIREMITSGRNKPLIWAE